MRVMLLIQRFPPHHLGGYELRFMDLANGLRERGHQVSVVTSTFDVDGPRTDKGNVHRILTLVDEVHGWRGIARLTRVTWGDARRLRRVLDAERPQAILIGNFYGLSSALWNVLRRSGARLVLDVSNEWLLDISVTHGNWFRIWERASRSRLRRLAQGVIRTVLNAVPGGSLRTSFPGLGASAVYATAPHLVEQLHDSGGLGDQRAQVCHSGIDLPSFPFARNARPLRQLLYIGRLKSVKGVHTAVSALDHLDDDVTLTIVGIPDDPDYETQLRAQAAPLGERVTFADTVPREALPEVFHRHDALLFPTVWDEPFSRLPLEAMACGVPVIATPTGGTPQAIEHGVTGLLFETGDASALAAAVRSLSDDESWRQAIIAAGRSQVEERFGLDAAVGRIERVIRVAVASGEA